MPKYIDSDKLIAKTICAVPPYGGGQYNKGWDDAMSRMRSIIRDTRQPDSIADVVRCKDCYYGKIFMDRLMCHWNADKNGWGACGTNPDHYCARGKRKEAADDL